MKKREQIGNFICIYQNIIIKLVLKFIYNISSSLLLTVCNTSIDSVCEGSGNDIIIALNATQIKKHIFESTGDVDRLPSHYIGVYAIAITIVSMLNLAIASTA